MQKGKPTKMDLPLFKNDIARIFIDMKRVFYIDNNGLGLMVSNRNRKL